VGNKSRPSFKKRQKEMARQQKQMDKRAQRQAKSEQRGQSPRTSGEADPDLAGIRPGPQALPTEWDYAPPPERLKDDSG
jgi:hypothetical protein